MKNTRAIDRRPLLTMLYGLGVAIAMLVTALPVHAQGAPSRMAECNHQSAGKSGADRKAFMHDCLSNKPAPPPSRQDKMRMCNHDATGRKGDDRKAFMKDCLSNH
ncbi:PsiF family protein [Robbsia betulipollinis]